MIGKKPEDRLLTRKTRRGKNRPIVDHRDAWDRIRKEAGYPDLIMHDLRRSAAKRQTRLGISEGEIMDNGGWTTRATFDRYNIKSLSTARNTAAKLNADDLRRKQEALSPSLAPSATETPEAQRVAVQ